MALTLRQQRFAREYLVDLNATKAATRAGYGAASARTQGCRLLKKVEIQEFIQGVMERRAERADAPKKLYQCQKCGHRSLAEIVEPPAAIEHRSSVDQVGALLDNSGFVPARTPCDDAE